MSHHDVDGVWFCEWDGPCGHFEHNDSEGVDVGSAVDVVSADLFGG